MSDSDEDDIDGEQETVSAETQSAESDSDIREEISLEYSLGLGSLEGGNAGIQNGIFDFNVEMYEEAVESFESAGEAFERAEDQFSKAVDLTYEIGDSEAREICEKGESHASILRNAAEQYQQAASLAEDGRGPDDVNTRLEQAESLETEAEKSSPRDQSVLDSVLGLD